MALSPCHAHSVHARSMRDIRTVAFPSACPHVALTLTPAQAADDSRPQHQWRCSNAIPSSSIPSATSQASPRRMAFPLSLLVLKVLQSPTKIALEIRSGIFDPLVNFPFGVRIVSFELVQLGDTLDGKLQARARSSVVMHGDSP